MNQESVKLIEHLKKAGVPFTEMQIELTEEMIRNSMAVDKFLLDKRKAETMTECKLRFFDKNKTVLQFIK